MTDWSWLAWVVLALAGWGATDILLGLIRFLIWATRMARLGVQVTRGEHRC